MATMADKLIPTPSQTVGPFFHLGIDAAGMGRSDRRQPEWPQGERIAIEGRVLDGDGAPVPDAVIEVWQANAAGRYNHPDDPRSGSTDDAPLDPDFRGFGRVATGCRRANSVLSRSSPARCRDAAMRGRRRISMSHCSRAACCATSIRGSISRATRATQPTRCCRRSTTQRCAARCWPARRKARLPVYRFDIVLQGENETAFLDI